MVVMSPIIVLLEGGNRINAVLSLIVTVIYGVIIL